PAFDHRAVWRDEAGVGGAAGRRKLWAPARLRLDCGEQRLHPATERRQERARRRAHDVERDGRALVVEAVDGLADRLLEALGRPPVVVADIEAQSDRRWNDVRHG